MQALPDDIRLDQHFPGNKVDFASRILLDFVETVLPLEPGGPLETRRP